MSIMNEKWGTDEMFTSISFPYTINQGLYDH
jgi:hypothetical protein